jgi:hypothetical protein
MEHLHTIELYTAALCLIWTIQEDGLTEQKRRLVASRKVYAGPEGLGIPHRYETVQGFNKIYVRNL